MVETEAVLLSRFATTGDAEAFAEIIRRHAGLVYGAALRILADVDRASDVVQETFLQLTKGAHSVTGWLPGGTDFEDMRGILDADPDDPDQRGKYEMRLWL